MTTQRARTSSWTEHHRHTVTSDILTYLFTYLLAFCPPLTSVTCLSLRRYRYLKRRSLGVYVYSDTALPFEPKDTVSERFLYRVQERFNRGLHTHPVSVHYIDLLFKSDCFKVNLWSHDRLSPWFVGISVHIYLLPVTNHSHSPSFVSTGFGVQSGGWYRLL